MPPPVSLPPAPGVEGFALPLPAPEGTVAGAGVVVLEAGAPTSVELVPLVVAV